jgi:hypothetical protein
VPRTEHAPTQELRQSQEIGPLPQEFDAHWATGNPLAIATHTVPAAQLVLTVPL